MDRLHTCNLELRQNYGCHLDREKLVKTPSFYNYSAERSKALHLLQLFFVCMSVITACYYVLDIMRQTVCPVINSIIVDGYASLFNCTTAVQASDSMTASS